jgi:Immunity protein 26
MRVLKSMEEANECTAIRLTEKRQRAKVGDIFRLSPAVGVYLWGRLIKRAQFFGLGFELNLVYLYDVVGFDRPTPEALKPGNLILGPSVVNNLGFSRGYWEIVGSEPVTASDTLDRHLFVKFKGTGRPDDYELVDEAGVNVRMKHSPADKLLAQSGIGNYNLIDWLLQDILRSRGNLLA